MGNARIYAQGIDAIGRKIEFLTTKGKTLSEIRADNIVMLRTHRFESAIECFNGMTVETT